MFIDLTEPINDAHWRYPNYIRTLQFQKRDNWINSPFMSLDHGFTYLSTPASMLEGGKAIDDYDVFEDLQGKCAILQLDGVKENVEITREMLEAAYAACEPADILIVVTGFGRIHDSYTHDYWDLAPHLGKEAADYLVSLGPKLVCFDFAEDPGMCMDPEERYKPENNYTHKVLFESGIPVIDYINFAWKIPVRNACFYALPLRVAVEGKFTFGSVRAVVKY